MSEYGTSLAEIENEWTPGITMLMARNITERYQRQNGKQTKTDDNIVSEHELLKTDMIRG